jgi:ABC-type nitrate/sulfonate/bicarbonate transport system ATPase subunit
VDVANVLARVGTSAILVTHDIREAVFLADRVAIMGTHPGHIKEIVRIDHPRPRTEEFQHSHELARLENHIWKALHQ